MSLANTGIIRKHPNKPKTLGKFVAATKENSDELVPSDPAKNLDSLDRSAWRGRATSNPSLGCESNKWKKRPGSASPILSRPTSSHTNPAQDYSNNSNSRVSPHPHHFDHPEKHVDGSLIRSGLVRSRSSSLTNMADLKRPKTPPAPHHSDHPLKMIKKEDFSRPSSSPSRKSSANDKNKAKNEPKACYIRFGSSNPGANWDQMALQSALRQENDFPIERRHLPRLLEKKKGDSIHSPLSRVQLDTGVFFLDRLSLKGV